MKQILFFSILFLMAAIFISCQKEEIETSENSNPNFPTENSIYKVVAEEFNKEQYNLLLAANETRLALLYDKAGGGNSRFLTVPDDYETIQEAVDAASSGSTIHIKPGTYNETVIIITPNLKMQAMEDVLLNGGFILNESADNVRIQNFNIDISISSNNSGITAVAASGVQIVHNTITGQGDNGIKAISVDNMTIRDNDVSGMDMGIIICSSSDFGSGSCTNNTILSNIVTGNAIVGVQLQGDSDNNKIINNHIHYIGVDGNPSITILSVSDHISTLPELFGECENNLVRSNACHNSGIGIGITDGGSNNTIGPNNIFNTNTYFGIYLYGSSNNFVMINTALENGICDIHVELSHGNTFRRNNADCTWGL